MTATRTLAAGLFAAFALLAQGSASAADLYGENYRYQRDDDYDAEPRYADRYGDRDQRYDTDEGYRGDGYRDDRYRDAPYPYRGSTKDGDYLPPPDRRPRFSDADRYTQPGCAPRWQVRNRLEAYGWRNFQKIAVRPRVVILRAERPNGRPFDLKLDRCSGEVVDQRPARLPRYGIYGPGPRRFGWAN
ncbi:MAG: hypothetical protein ACT4N2_01125 [Hyphomicrobium sp.]